MQLVCVCDVYLYSNVIGVCMLNPNAVYLAWYRVINQVEEMVYAVNPNALVYVC